ncbi:ATP-binding protein [Pseudalkalibacillus caeni]|uniref:histidine kinase n=1 Tax=Exobacillus caeni TaxID=2574798 RepID=A0A5R9EZD7_9BACL|nr:sensor histidine kinase [Pseudalkalibacillus caeni]TLS36577.1 sensor histidine kinase [Pseudalkalibacillus caeni]
MKGNALPIQLKITILAFSVVLFSLLIGVFISVSNIESTKEEELRKRTMITARTVAQVPEVKRHIKEPQGWKAINPIVERIRIINNADYIVVLNKERIRYSHPVSSMLGTVSKGKDEAAAFAEHTYTSLAKGEAGVAVRAFVPILNERHEQIGVVIAGNLMPTFWEMLAGMKRQVGLIMLLTLAFGIIGSALLARHIKEQMFHLEPHEIVRLLVERTAAFNAMHEGVIAIDNRELITVFNEKAKNMLGVKGDVVGKPIREVVTDTRLPEVLQRNNGIFNQEIQVQQRNIMSNRVPILVEGQVAGAVAIFQDRTEVTKMAEELTGVKAFVEALRVQNHEHLNKLHTIAGLIQLGKQEKALHYVFQVFEEQEELTRTLSKNIGHDSLIGLLLSKVSRGKELGIKVDIDRNSRLEEFPEGIDQHDFVLILGNLIENAFAALNDIEDRKKRVFVGIEQNEQTCTIVVEDNGKGISEEEKEKIFVKGYTTKQEVGHGIGLYMVKNIVEKVNGELEVDSFIDEGTSFVITLPMHEFDK